MVNSEPDTQPYLIRKRFEYLIIHVGEPVLVTYSHLGGSGFYQVVEAHRFMGNPVYRVVANDTITPAEYDRRTAHCHETVSDAYEAAYGTQAAAPFYVPS